MSNSTENTWYSGSWNENGNNSEVPYNGLKIAATAKYSLPTSPPSLQILVSVNLDVVDYTYDPNGVSSTLTLPKSNIWYGIPIPEDDNVSPPIPNIKFTVTDIENINLGKVRLDSNPSGTFLNIQFSFGPDHRKQEEIGYIMKFDQTYTEGQDPIQVEE